MTPIEVLRQARALIADPSHWCQLGYAKNKRGRNVGARSPLAVQWCAFGAGLHVAGNDAHAWFVAQAALNEAARVLYPKTPDAAGVNDLVGHAAVMSCFDHAIATREREEATP